MKSTTGRRVALSVALVTVLTGTAACTSSGKSEDGPEPTRLPLAALRSAERSTDRAHSARVRSATVMGTQLSVEADGTLGWSGGLTGTLTITYTGGTTAETMRALGVTSMEARYLSDAYYARMGDVFAAKTGGKHWIKYVYDDIKDLAGGAGANLADQMRTTTPNQLVKLLLDSEDVRKVGEETVDGRPTTHYSGTVEAGGVADAEVRRRLEEAGVTTETVDIWIDDRDLLVKKVERAETSAGAYTQTAYYSDYGTKATAAKPPVGDTQDFKELLEKRSSTS
ncbi:LppX_LprAFG lipoprotein [Streptomyces sp. HUAS ZL42]|uniref:LppX_LprAFG lipoprotein n=1 Tax=Streptomyces sp. HUAS ZL42 TaxID=3231715 RepID=UPI00345EDC4A